MTRDIVDTQNSNIIFYSSTGSFAIFAPQVELCPFASSYIPTEVEAATRATDIVFTQRENNLPTANDDFSISGRYAGEVGGNTYPRLFEVANSTDTLIFAHFFDDAPGTVRLTITPAVGVGVSRTCDFIGAETFLDGKSRTILFVRKGDQMTCFVNGKQYGIVRSVAGIAGKLRPRIVIGASNSGRGERALQGTAISIKAWHIALSAEQAAALGNG